VLLVLGLGSVIAVAVVHDRREERREEQQCAQAGGRRVCHDDSTIAIDSKGRPVVGVTTICRCLTPDGREIVIP